MSDLQDDIEFLQKQLIKLGVEGLRKARPRIGSRTLRDALEFFVDDINEEIAEGMLNVPHFWAIYSHDGRRSFKHPLAPNKKLVWYENRQDDPRLKNGHSPVNESDIRRLTPGEYREGLRRNRIRRRNGQQPFMIVVPLREEDDPFVSGVGPEAFFDNKKGMAGFTTKAKQQLKTQFPKHVLDLLRKDETLNVQDEAVLRIR